MAPNFERKYTPEQKEACIFAAVDRNVSPLRRVSELAAAGELVGRAGKPLEPFDVTYSMLSRWKYDERKKRDGQKTSPLTERSAVDAGEELRRRLVAATEHRVQVILDRQHRDKDRKVDWEELRLAARAVREIQQIRPPKDASTAPAPSKVRDGRASAGSATGGALLAAMRAEAKSKEAPPENGASGPSAS